MSKRLIQSSLLNRAALLIMLAFGFGSVAGAQTAETETIRIDADLVNLNVSVLSRNPAVPAMALEQKAFQVLENGAVQEVSFFASSDAPFDLVLLLDLSGSTADKISLIRKTSKRFVDSVRPGDRVAVVTFTDRIDVVSLLSNDQKALKKSIDEMKKPLGGTNVWDALRFVLDHMVGKSRLENRRSAIVMMTDGVDNALPGMAGDGSQTTFEELIAVTRRWDTMVIPVYLDTEKESVRNQGASPEAYAIAREQLNTLARESGNIVYRANKVKDLQGVYAQVIHDLSTVYSIGYRPSNQTRDGMWRPVEVRIPDHPELVVRAKRGYYSQLSNGQSSP